MSMSSNLMEPFVLIAELIDEDGKAWAIPAGVELADCSKHAFGQAIRRWPEYNLFQPIPWEKAPPGLRFAAIDADRQITKNPELCVC